MVLRQDPDIEMDPDDRLNPSRHAMPRTPKKKGVKVRHSRATMVYCYAGLLFVVGILIPSAYTWRPETGECLLCS